LENYQIINIEEELKPTKPKTRFIFKKPLKGTYKSQNLGKGKGFGHCGGLFESVRRVVGVQGLDQEGECESRISSSQFLITNSRLGVLRFRVHQYC